MDRVRSRIEQENRYRLAVLGLVAIALVAAAGWAIAVTHTSSVSQ